MELVVEGAGNEISIAEDFRLQPAHIVVSGSGNRLVIGRSCICLPGCSLRVGGGSSITVGPGCNLAKLNALLDRQAALRIGSGVGFTNATMIQMPERAVVQIGDGCLFADETMIFASDMHSVVDVESGQRINAARDVTIGERVWLGGRAVVLKGAAIGADSVVAFGTVVAGDVAPNSMVAGVPARVIRSGVAWHHALLP